MTVALLDDCTRPVVVDAPAGAGSPAGATPARNFFDGCDTVYTLPKYVAPCGPPNPNGRTLAQVVREAVA